MLKRLQEDTEQRMRKSIQVLQLHFSKIRTGRPNPALLDEVKVDYFGAETPLSQVANVKVGPERTLIVAPWDAQLLPEIEKSIQAANLGVGVNSDGELVRVTLPALNEESRRDFVRHAKEEAEAARVAIRNVRRDVNAQLREMIKNKEIAKDDERRSEEEAQKLTDQFIREVDQMLAAKEAELMEV